ncbi:hypothetical protein [Bosea lathyri]|jgi:hypothetical protein|uniref:Uncharacterized protein n=1 Tax=Bosea lathyri TaxID=1036778 RepID=A0A1H5UWM6_9HYPH|nr:hypothetical protein [Bosea lathyri]SEF79406.1 hypothetical protein SAMN04488115_10255 [Bosea lathyri]
MPVPSMRGVPGAPALLDSVYEKAWAEICARGRFVSDGESNREWLGYIIIGLSIAGIPGDLAGMAVDQFVATVPPLAPLEPRA